jgi:ubiquinone/menaquinone biosynthesis C-methylase UbiE
LSVAAHAALFDAEAAHYEAAFHGPNWGGYALRSRHTAILDALEGESGSVLDAGMGPGQICRDLTDRGWTVSGLDVSPGMVAHARAKVPEAADRMVVGDLRRLPFGDEEFDAVVSSGVLDYVPDYAAAVRELVRVLRPGGVAVITMPNPHAPWILWKLLVANPLLRAVKRLRPGGRPAPAKRDRPPAPARFAEIAADAGVEVLSSTYTSFCISLWPLEELAPQPSVRIAEWLERRRALERWCGTQVVVVGRRRA